MEASFGGMENEKHTCGRKKKKTRYSWIFLLSHSSHTVGHSVTEMGCNIWRPFHVPQCKINSDWISAWRSKLVSSPVFCNSYADCINDFLRREKRIMAELFQNQSRPNETAFSASKHWPQRYLSSPGDCAFSNSPSVLWHLACFRSETSVYTFSNSSRTRPSSVSTLCWVFCSLSPQNTQNVRTHALMRAFFITPTTSTINNGGKNILKKAARLCLLMWKRNS